jgi:hypothetical protein
LEVDFSDEVEVGCLRSYRGAPAFAEATAGQALFRGNDGGQAHLRQGYGGQARKIKLRENGSQRLSHPAKAFNTEDTEKHAEKTEQGKGV